MFKFPRKEVGEQGKRNRKEGKEKKETKEGMERKGKDQGEKGNGIYLCGIEKKEESTQEETKVLSLLPGRKKFF